MVWAPEAAVLVKRGAGAAATAPRHIVNLEFASVALALVGLVVLIGFGGGVTDIKTSS